MLVSTNPDSESIKIRPTTVIYETPDIPDTCGIQTRANQAAVGKMLLEHENVVVLHIWRPGTRACDLFTGSANGIV